MEFPATGECCALDNCKQLDFLPFKCDYCHLTFCKTHFNAESHKCAKSVSNITSPTKQSLNFVCSKDDCKETSLIEMLCYNCKNHFCIKHRYHGCLETNNDETLRKLKKWQIPKKQFAHVKAIVDQEVSDSLRKSKNTAMANKVQLMRMKSIAVGPKNVPTNERCYFLVYPPIIAASKITNVPKGIYMNKNWTVGKIIDSMADILKIPNNNNTSITNKLHLFHYNTGASICNKMDTPVIDLFESSVLIDGQCVILEYSDDTAVDLTLYE
ncbi:hypothetical protein KPH14_008157 [Odynerus spinipes]|uniref:AN1-type domain-containing protein n=1 Tax=Odynerus spinipes TaxID=1348599 RepID=A0AAD9R8T7_9HYME|nr:hypothetical protein KPH14_008157 [Odynerus spinipes]